MHLVFAVPCSWDRTSGGNLYNMRLVDALQDCGHIVEVIPTAFISNLPFEQADLIIIDGLLSQTCQPSFRSPVPIIGLIHVPGSFLIKDQEQKKIASRLDQQFLSCLDAAIFVSQETYFRSKIAFDLPEPFLILNPGRPQIDSANLSGEFLNDQKSFEILNVGRLDHNKNQEILVRCLRRAINLFPHMSFRLSLCGSSEDRYFEDKVLPRIQMEELEKQISWHGEISVNYLDYFFKKADLYICSSAYESWGMSIMEASGYGLPIFNFSKGGSEELTRLAGGYQIENEEDFDVALTSLLESKESFNFHSICSKSAFEAIPGWYRQGIRLSSWMKDLSTMGGRLKKNGEKNDRT